MQSPWLISGAAQAALHDRGGGLLYDDILNVTWLQDANYAATSGYCGMVGNCSNANGIGTMTWQQATTWATGLVYHDTANSQDYAGWRLASNSPVNGAWNYNYSANGSTDLGYNIISPKSELAYMYYVNLGLKGYNSPTGVYQSDFGIFGNGTFGGQANVGLVKNLQANAYWSGTAFAPSSISFAWGFYPTPGIQEDFNQGDGLYAWAVHSGDIAAVPEPESYTMLLTGLGLLGLTRFKRKSA